MNDTLFEQLIHSSEGQTLDFKTEFYKFPDDAYKSTQDDTLEFVKDVTAFYNTKRDSEAYIICGIKEEGGKIIDVPGISEFYDNAKLQTKIQGKIAPIPIFEAYKYTYNGNLAKYMGKTFYIIEVALPEHDRPATVEKDQSVKKHPKSPTSPTVEIKQGIVYIRKNSNNTIAIGDDLTMLHSWLKELSEKRKKHTKDDYHKALKEYNRNRTAANRREVEMIAQKLNISGLRMVADLLIPPVLHRYISLGIILIIMFSMSIIPLAYRKDKEIRAIATIDTLVSQEKYLEALQKIPDAYTYYGSKEMKERESIRIIEVAVTKADTSIKKLAKALDLYHKEDYSDNIAYHDLILKVARRLCIESKCEEAKKIVNMYSLDENTKQKIIKEIDTWQTK